MVLSDLNCYPNSLRFFLDVPNIQIQQKNLKPHIWRLANTASHHSERQCDAEWDWTWIKFARLTHRGSGQDALSLLTQSRISVRNASTLHQRLLAFPSATLPQWPTYRQLRRTSDAKTSPWFPLPFPPLLLFWWTHVIAVYFSPFPHERGMPCGFSGIEP